MIIDGYLEKGVRLSIQDGIKPSEILAAEQAEASGDLEKAGRTGLVKKMITDSRGHRTSRWVRAHNDTDGKKSTRWKVDESGRISGETWTRKQGGQEPIIESVTEDKVMPSNDSPKDSGVEGRMAVDKKMGISKQDREEMIAANVDAFVSGKSIREFKKMDSDDFQSWVESLIESISPYGNPIKIIPDDSLNRGNTFIISTGGDPPVNDLRISCAAYKTKKRTSTTYGLPSSGGEASTWVTPSSQRLDISATNRYTDFHEGKLGQSGLGIDLKDTRIDEAIDSFKLHLSKLMSRIWFS